LNFEEIAKSWTNFRDMGELDWFNNQPAFAQLALDRNYLGWWESSLTRAPDIVYTKIRVALENSLLYPDWQFLRDFPGSVFEDTRRRGDTWNYTDIGKQPPPPYAVLAVDPVVPLFPELAVQENNDEEEEPSRPCPLL
jgi:hypothetical protein